MPLLINLRHLDAHNIRLQGELPIEELDIDTRDEMIQLRSPLEYDFEVQKVEHGLLVHGRWETRLDCECVRCLKAFKQPVAMADWTIHLPLQGEEAVPVVSDCVDLTPFLREDILLEFPQHPLCDPDCGGLPKTYIGKGSKASNSGQPDAGSPAWNELNKLKL